MAQVHRDKEGAHMNTHAHVHTHTHTHAHTHEHTRKSMAGCWCSYSHSLWLDRLIEAKQELVVLWRCVSVLQFNHESLQRCCTAQTQHTQATWQIELNLCVCFSFSHTHTRTQIHTHTQTHRDTHTHIPLTWVESSSG